MQHKGELNINLIIFHFSIFVGLPLISEITKNFWWLTSLVSVAYSSLARYVNYIDT